MSKSILIFRIGQLGDSLVALPCIWALRNHFPNAQLTLLCDRHPGKSYVLGADLFRDGGLVDEFETYAIQEGGFQRAVHFGSLLGRLRAKKYDALAYLAPSGRTLRQMRRDYLFFRAAGIRQFFGISSVPSVDAKRSKTPLPQVPHEADYLLSRLAESGIPVPPEGFGCMNLNLSRREEQEVKSWACQLPGDGDRTWVGFGPGSKMPAKRWPLEQFAIVGRALIEKFDIWPVIFGGPDELEKGRELLKTWGRGYNAAGQLGLRASAQALKHCALYVGNDTGTMHLAAAAGTKCVAVFSARDCPGRWDPYGQGHQVLRVAIECEGCRLIECVDRQNECLARVLPRDVISACENLLSSKSRELATAV